MDTVLERIAAWQAAGLIDAETAERLRADEGAHRLAHPAPTQSADESARDRVRGPSTIGQMLGPGVSIGEMFSYLGGAFLLAAYDAFLVRTAGFGPNAELTMTLGLGAAAVVLTVIGLVLRRGDERRRRASGVVFAVSVAQAAGAGAGIAMLLDVGPEVVGVVVALIAAAVAVGHRLVQPALLTQLTMLAALTGLAAAILSWFTAIVAPGPAFTEFGEVAENGVRTDPLLAVIVSAGAWLAFAVAVGLIGLREASSGDPAADRRAALSRIWAGLVAVVGLAMAITRSDYLGGNEFGRVLEPWVADVALVGLAVVLVERAFRRDASTFVYAAALALIIALTDFNFSYLTDSTEAGLLVEGLILLGAGFAADRLRRRVGRVEAPPPASAPDDDGPEIVEIARA